MRTALMMGFALVTVFGFLHARIATAQPPAAAGQDNGVEAADDQNQPGALPAHVYPYPGGTHPPVFVTEVYKHSRYGRQRHLNVFVYGMKPDVWQILHCYEPCCCRSGSICCRSYHRPYNDRVPPAAPTPADNEPLLPPAPLGVDPAPPEADPFGDESP